MLRHTEAGMGLLVQYGSLGIWKCQENYSKAIDNSIGMNVQQLED